MVNETGKMITYTSPEYEPSGAVDYFDSVPRYGYTENSYEVIEGNRSDYIRGILLIPGLVVAITIVWFTILAVFTCKCRKSYLSGRGFQKSEGALVRGIVRGIFLLSTSVVLVSSILFLVMGNSSLADALRDFEGPKDKVFEVANDGADTIAKIGISLRNFAERTEMLQENIAGGICLDLPQDLQNLLSTISNSIEISDFNDELDQLEDFENSLRESFSSERESQISKFMEDVEKIIGSLRYGAIPYMVTTFILVSGVLFSWRNFKSKFYSSFLSFFILPLFVLFELISGVITSLLGVVLIIFSDFCTGGEDQSPEGSIRIILDTVQFDEIVRQSLDHYIVNGCRTVNIFGGLTNTENALTDISEEINQAVDSFRGFVGTICSDSTELDTLLVESKGDLVNLFDGLRNALRLTECENINSIFVTAVHEGACRSTPNALWLVFGCFFAIWVGGLFVLTTRAACKPKADINHQESEA